MAGRMLATLTVVNVVLAFLYVSKAEDYTISIFFKSDNTFEILRTNKTFSQNCTVFNGSPLAVCGKPGLDIGMGVWYELFKPNGGCDPHLDDNFSLIICPLGEKDKTCSDLINTYEINCKDGAGMIWSVCHKYCFYFSKLFENQGVGGGQSKCNASMLNCTRCECVKKENNLKCNCQGYTSNQDIDECQEEPSWCDHNCTTTNRSFYCWCRAGYLLDTSDNKTCHDINECHNRSVCDHNCTNTNGSYYCTCRTGYHFDTLKQPIFYYFFLNGALFGLGAEEFNMATSKKKCHGLNGFLATFDTQQDYLTAVKILTNTNVAAGKGVWIDFKKNLTPQKFDWNIEPFGSDVWASKEPSKECKENADPEQCCARMQWENSTVYQGLMDNNCSSSYFYLCRLPPTFCSQGITMQNPCVDVDECTLGYCSQQCNNTIGGFECSCYHGYKVRDEFPTLCDDVDECLDQPSLCGQNCTNTNGSYYCSCRNGYYLDKTDNSTCHDINECENSTVCGHNCTNTNGCSCRNGYILDTDDKTCHDINECDNKTLCSHNCTNTAGSFYCTCRNGYYLDTVDNKTCHDINECDNRSVCDHNCTNTNGSYYCSCRNGYYLDKTDNSTCHDINECDNRSVCDHNCTNIEGSFFCSCRDGYILGNNRKTCHDINECDNTNLCQHRCHNTPGSYFCACPDGFQTSPDGHSCVRRNSSHVCPCKCSSKRSLTHQQAEKDAHMIQNQLSVVSRDLSTFTRKKTCADDPRPTAQTAGYIGVALLIITVGVIVLLDLIQLYRFLWNKIN